MTLSRDPRRLADQLRTKAAKCGSYARFRDEYNHIADVLGKSKGQDMSDDRIRALESENAALRSRLATAEADALEKAAQRAEVSPDSHWGPTIAAGIRALKPKAKA
jgi:hypothetical protein